MKIGERSAGTDAEEGLYIHLSVRTLDFPGDGTRGKLGTAYGTDTTNWIERLHGPRD